MKTIDKEFIIGDESDGEDDEAEYENIFLERNKLLEEKSEQIPIMLGPELLERMTAKLTPFHKED